MHTPMAVGAERHGIEQRVIPTTSQPFHVVRLKVWLPLGVAERRGLSAKLTYSLCSTFCHSRDVGIPLVLRPCDGALTRLSWSIFGLGPQLLVRQSACLFIPASLRSAKFTQGNWCWKSQLECQRKNKYCAVFPILVRLSFLVWRAA